jgi:hypothetical protein
VGREPAGLNSPTTVKVEGQQQKHTLTVTKISDSDMAAEHGGGGTIEFKKEK